ncbi:MAG TPA: PACE efflux transporter [Paracoccaceae bacterium]
MRRTADRIRHALSFELIALAMITPLGAMVFDTPMKEMGVVTVVSATIATLWNYLYNLMFDHAMQRLRGSVIKTPAIRVLHAVLFEAGLLLVLIPFIALYLGVSLWTAFVMDVAFAGFYLVYAFAFNWAYDVIFPIPGTDSVTKHSQTQAGSERW